MPSKIQGTYAVVETPNGPARLKHSARKPRCEKCGTTSNVVRLWHGDRKMWVCKEHYLITSTKRKEATLIQRITHRLPEPDTFELGELLPNRQYRRRRTK